MFKRILTFIVLFFGALFFPAGSIFSGSVAFAYFFSLPFELFLLGIIMDALGRGPTDGFFMTSFVILILICEILKEFIENGKITGAILTFGANLLAVFLIFAIFADRSFNFFIARFLGEFFLTSIVFILIIGWKFNFQLTKAR
jgi:hypothetical protein